MNDDTQDKPKKTQLPSDPWKGDPGLRTTRIAEVNEPKSKFTGEKGKKTDEKK